MNNIATTTTLATRKAKQIFDAIAPTVDSLSARWMDESEYEDINEYKAVLDTKLATFGTKVEKMNKRPFGFTYKVDGATYKIKATAKTITHQLVMERDSVSQRSKMLKAQGFTHEAIVKALIGGQPTTYGFFFRTCPTEHEVRKTFFTGPRGKAFDNSVVEFLSYKVEVL